MKRTRRPVCRGVIAALVAVVSVVSHAEAGAAPPADERAVTERTEAILNQLQEDGDFVAASQRADELFDAVIGYVDVRRPGAFTEAAFARRLISQLSRAKQEDAEALLPWLRVNPKFARALAFVAKPTYEDMAGVYALANRLRIERGDLIEDYPFLAAAICVVHDEPLARSYNENRVSAPDAITIFDYYTANAGVMNFGVTNVPAELMIYVVDVTATMGDLNWALANYQGDKHVGQRFFDIQYDHEHYRTGQPKKCTLAGWGLANIAQHGGVCSDQAYFAVTVGKAIGVPTAYAYGRGNNSAHAWVGFLEANEKNAWWNFSLGRQGVYEGVRGVVLDPQVRVNVPDSYVSLLADFALTDIEDRYAAAAITDAVIRLRELHEALDDAEWKPEAVIENSRSRRGATIRDPRLEHQIALLESAVRKAPGYPAAWFVLRELADEGLLSRGDKHTWAEVLSRLCGGKYPDFMLAILRPMVQTIEDVHEQNGFWNRAFRQFEGRNDLCAEIRMEQAAMWEEAGEHESAIQCCIDVIQRYANAGPFVVDALARAEKILRAAEREAEVPALYADAWSYIKRPENMATMFAIQSNWYQVGMRYAKKLEEAGDTAAATEIRNIIRGAG